MLGHLDRHQGSGDDVHPRPAVLLRDVEPEEPHLPDHAGEARVVRRLELARVGVELRLEGDDLLADEAPNEVDEKPLLFARPEVHGPRSFRSRPWPAPALPSRIAPLVHMPLRRSARPPVRPAALMPDGAGRARAAPSFSGGSAP